MIYTVYIYVYIKCIHIYILNEYIYIYLCDLGLLVFMGII